MYSLRRKNVPNATDPAGIIANGLMPANGINFNAPFLRSAPNRRQLGGAAKVFATVAYLSCQFTPLDNISFRPEFYNDMQGQRTGTKTRYVTLGLGWQHWFSPQVEMRPEVSDLLPRFPRAGVQRQLQRDPCHSAQ